MLNLSNARLARAQEGKQVAGENFKEIDLGVQPVRAAEGRHLVAIAAAHVHKILKTDAKQEYLYCTLGDEIVYVRPPDW